MSEDQKDFDQLSDDDFLNQAFGSDAPPLSDSEGERSTVVEESLRGPADETEEEATTPQETAGEETEQTEDGVQPPAESESGDVADVSDEEFEASHTTSQQVEAGGESDENDVFEESSKKSVETEDESEKTEKDSETSQLSQTSPDTDSGPGSENTTETEASENEEPDYKALYEQVMSSFKANGTEIKPENPEDAVRLMQMGANYTKKMQALKPNLKMMRMLENNDLLDESKLSFLIDLSKKDPKAVQKLIHDAKIDPMEIDTSEEPTYQPGNHQVSDQEMAFQEVVQDVMDTETGKETITLIHKDWDQASKEVIGDEPEVLRVINAQRANGIYDQISTEVKREQMLGRIPSGTPFIQAYKQVGDRLQAEGKLVPKSTSTPQTGETTTPRAQSKEVLEQRAEPARKPMSNGEKAKAAASGPKAGKSKPRSFDPFSMSDEEIMAIPDPTLS